MHLYYLIGNSTSCTEKSSGLSNYLYLFIAGNFLHGVGGAALYTLGAPLLDDNVPVKKSPIYIGSCSNILFISEIKNTDITCYIF